MSKLLLHARSSLPALRTLGRFDTVRTVSATDISTFVKEGSMQGRVLWRYGVESKPIHLFVRERKQRRASTPDIVAHLSTNEFPSKSFISLGEGVYASSPEFCFLQMADELDYIDLIRYGYELCAGYMLDDSAPGGFVQSGMLTDTKKMKSYLGRIPWWRGCRKATIALNYIADGSRSPRETALAMSLCLPTRWGGYQLPKPELNYKIDVGFDIEGFSNRYVDLYWPNKSFGIEYESTLIHADQEKMTHDSVREKILKEQGVQLLRVTKEELSNPLRYELIVKLTARALGRKNRPAKSSVAKARRALAHRLFAPHREI